MERILLKESQADHTGNLKGQLLIIGKYIAADQLDDLHQAALLVKDCHDLVSVIHKALVHILLIPGSQVCQVLTVAGQPLDRREMSRIGERFVQAPEAAHETLGILGDRFGEVAALGRYGANDRHASFRSV